MSSIIIIDVKPILWQTIVLFLSVIIGITVSLVLAIANEREKRYILRNYPSWTETHRYVNKYYTSFTIVLIAIALYNLVTIARYYFLGTIGELIVYLLFIVVAVIDTLFFQYILSFSVHIPLPVSKIVSRIVSVATAILLFIYGVKTPVKPVIDPQTKLVDYVATGELSWYADVYFAYIGTLLGLTIITLITLLISQWKKLDKYDRLRIFTMMVGYTVATTLGTILNYIELNLLIEALIYSLVVTLCTIIFASGPLINLYVLRKRRETQKIKQLS